MKAATVSSVVARNGIGPDYQFELAKLLSIAPAITEVFAIDETGRTQVYLSRFRVAPSANDQDFFQGYEFCSSQAGHHFLWRCQF